MKTAAVCAANVRVTTKEGERTAVALEDALNQIKQATGEKILFVMGPLNRILAPTGDAAFNESAHTFFDELAAGFRFRSGRYSTTRA